jgi:hypothetical protein
VVPAAVPADQVVVVPAAVPADQAVVVPAAVPVDQAVVAIGAVVTAASGSRASPARTPARPATPRCTSRG